MLSLWRFFLARAGLQSDPPGISWPRLWPSPTRTGRRLRGLLGLASSDFRNGSGLWIVPCHGVHTLGMGFPIDVIYLDRAMKVIHVQSDLRPWRFAPVRSAGASVLELPCRTAGGNRNCGGR